MKVIVIRTSSYKLKIMALKICDMSCVMNLLSGNQFAPVCHDNSSELIMVLVQKCLHISEKV